mgnify:CR=1 FL=1
MQESAVEMSDMQGLKAYGIGIGNDDDDDDEDIDDDPSRRKDS